MNQRTMDLINELTSLAHWLKHGLITEQEAIHRMQAIQEEFMDDQEVQ